MARLESRIFASYLKLGQNFAKNNIEKRKIFQVNGAALMSFLSCWILAFIFIATRNSVLIQEAYYTFLIGPVFMVVPFFQYKGWIRAARWCLTILGPLSVTFGIYFFQGTFLNLHYCFMFFAILPVLSFPTKEWWAILLFFIVSMVTFFYCLFVGVPPDFALYNLSYQASENLKLLTLGFGIFALHSVVLFSETSTTRNEGKLEAISNTDTLTGVLNRRGFETQLGLAQKHFKRNGELGALIFLDLDNFKPINDTYGHKAGDILLQQVSLRIRSCLREIDTIGRHGGDEFVIFLSFPSPNRDSLADRVLVVSEKIRKALAEPYFVDIRRHESAAPIMHRCTVSVGVCLFQGKFDLAEVIKHADLAMYQAKLDGKNKIIIDEQLLTAS